MKPEPAPLTGLIGLIGLRQGEAHAVDVEELARALDDALGIPVSRVEPVEQGRSARELDQLLLVVPADGGGARGPGPDLPAARERALVVVHAREGPPRAPPDWVAGLDVGTVHHLRAWSSTLRKADLAALVRRLRGEQVGLVLGGGGARGLAHIGVVAALREAGVAVDVFGGTSAGGGVAVLAALDYSVEDMIASIRDVWIDSGAFFELSRRPWRSVLGTTKLEARLDAWLGARTFAELWRPAFTVACCLERREAVVLDRGPLGPAIRATSAIPGLLPPVEIAGRPLVDGGVVDNLPVGAMRARGVARVIASQVSSPPRLGARPRHILSILGASVASMVQRQASAGEAELLVRPDLDELPALLFDDPGPYVEAGYRATMAALEAGL